MQFSGKKVFNFCAKVVAARSVRSAENSKGTIKSRLTKTNRLSKNHLHKWNGGKIFVYYEMGNKNLEWTGNKDRVEMEEWDH